MPMVRRERHPKGISEEEQRQYDQIKRAIKRKERDSTRGAEIAARLVLEKHRIKKHKPGE